MPDEITIEGLLEDYRKQYPEAEDPMGYLHGLGEDGLIEVLKNRKGRRIRFWYGEGLDEVRYRYLRLSRKQGVQGSKPSANSGPNSETSRT